MDADTSFKACWEKFAADRGLPDDPTSPMPRATVAQARRDALEFFSCGLVHQVATTRRLEELLPSRPNRRRVVG